MSGATRGSSDFLQELTDSVRANPVPAALIGMGVLWLFFGGSRTTLLGATRGALGTASDLAWEGAGQAGNAAYRGVSAVGSTISDVSRSVGETLSEVTSQIGETARKSVDAAGETIAAAGSQISNAASSTYEALGSGAKRATGLVSDASSLARQHSYPWRRSVQQELTQLFERQPLVLGGVGLAIGAAMAATLPITEAENRIMGEASNAVKEQAGKLTSDVGDEVKREAKTQGLTPASAAQAFDTLKEQVTSAVNTARADQKRSKEGAGSKAKSGTKEQKSG